MNAENENQTNKLNQSNEKIVPIILGVFLFLMLVALGFFGVRSYITKVEANAQREVSDQKKLLIAQDAAEDAIEEDGMITVYTDQKDLMKVRASLLEAGLKIEEAELQYVPNTEIEIVDEEISAKIEKVMDALDDLDDVVNVHTNAK